jgi:hypothetical protein
MPLLVKCSCGRELRVPDEYAGRRIKCRGCDTALTVPDAAEEAPRPPARGSASAGGMVRFNCEECGKAMQARAEYAGRVTKCPNCGLQQPIPGKKEEDETPMPARIQAERPAPRPRRDEDEEDDRRPAARRGRDREDEDEDDRRPSRRRDEDERDRDEEDEDFDRRRKRDKKKKRSMMPLLLGLAAGLCLLLGAGAAVGIYYWFFTGGGDLTAWVPGDGQGFVSVRVGDVWKLEDTQKAMAELRKQNPQMDPAQEMEKRFGMGPADIERLTVVVQDAEKQRVWMVISTAKPYDQDKLKGNLEGSSEKTHEDKKYLVGKVKDAPDNAALHFVNNRMMVAGPEEGVKAALGVAAKRNKGPLDDGLSLIGKSHLVAAFNIPPQLAQQMKAGMNNPFAQQYSAVAEVQSGTLVLNMDNKKTDLEAALRFPDDGKAKAAKEAADKGLKAVQGLLLIAGGAANQPEGKKAVEQVSKALDALKIEQSGSRVVLRTSIESGGSAAGVGALLGNMNLPGVQGPAKRMKGSNNLKQIALAFHNYASANGGRLPSDILDPKTKRPLLSWRVALLPYLEQDALYKEFRLNEAWNSPHNIRLQSRMPQVFAHPLRPGGSMTPYQLFTGPNTLYPNGQPKFPLMAIPDGTSNTILVVHSNRMRSWTEPGDLAYQPNVSPKLFLEVVEGAYQVCLADGSARAVKPTVSDQSLHNAINPADGKGLGPDF